MRFKRMTFEELDVGDFYYLGNGKDEPNTANGLAKKIGARLASWRRTTLGVDKKQIVFKLLGE